MVGGILVPVLLVCALFGIIMLVGIAFSYLALLWFNAEITRCPECRKRGAGELLNSEVVGTKTSVEWQDARKGVGWGSRERRQVRVTEETVEEQFKCERCGHEWTRTARAKTRTPA